MRIRRLSKSSFRVAFGNVIINPADPPIVLDHCKLHIVQKRRGLSQLCSNAVFLPASKLKTLLHIITGL